MQVGSLVITMKNFNHLKDIYNIEYPNRGDILTVSSIRPHPNHHASSCGIVLLTFEEINNSIGIANKTINNDYNFIEVLSPSEFHIAMEDAVKHNPSQIDLYDVVDL